MNIPYSSSHNQCNSTTLNFMMSHSIGGVDEETATKSTVENGHHKAAFKGQFQSTASNYIVNPAPLFYHHQSDTHQQFNNNQLPVYMPSSHHHLDYNPQVYNANPNPNPTPNLQPNYSGYTYQPQPQSVIKKEEYVMSNSSSPSSSSSSSSYDTTGQNLPACSYANTSVKNSSFQDDSSSLEETNNNTSAVATSTTAVPTQTQKPPIIYAWMKKVHTNNNCMFVCVYYYIISMIYYW